jgi:biotin carboxylase
MRDRDTILTINVVEPGLVKAVKQHSKILGKDLKGLVLVDREYAKQDPDRPRDASGLFKEIICEFSDQAGLQKILKPYTDRLLVATCRYESAIEPFRKVIPFLPYIHTPSETSLVWSTEKPLMRDRLHAFDETLVPRYVYMEERNVPRLKELTKEFNFPVILKPSVLAAGLLVTQCKTPRELKLAVDKTFRLMHKLYARERRGKKPRLLIEEMMQGDMYSTDAYVTHDGRVFCLPLVEVITAHFIGVPGFYSYRHIIPVNLSEKEIQKGFKAAEDSIKALNLSSTTTHIELFHTKDGWKIIEVGARIGGYREALYREAFGTEHYYNDLAVRMGLEPKMPGKPIRHAAGMNIYADEEGYITSIDGLEEAQKLESVVFLKSHAQVGDLALFAGNGGRLIVDGILSHKNSKKLEEDVAKVRELIKINVTKKQPA